MVDDLLLHRRLDLVDLSQAVNALVNLSRISPDIPRTCLVLTFHEEEIGIVSDYQESE